MSYIVECWQDCMTKELSYLCPGTKVTINDKKVEIVGVEKFAALYYQKGLTMGLIVKDLEEADGRDGS